jgi:hypothetical protein
MHAPIGRQKPIVSARTCFCPDRRRRAETGAAALFFAVSSPFVADTEQDGL